MPISWADWNRDVLPGVLDGLRREMERYAALTPEQQAAEKAETDALWGRARQHTEFLDYCAANKIDPNLVLPVREK